MKDDNEPETAEEHEAVTYGMKARFFGGLFVDKYATRPTDGHDLTVARAACRRNRAATIDLLIERAIASTQKEKR